MLPDSWLEDRVRKLERVVEAARMDVAAAKSLCGYHNKEVTTCRGPKYNRFCLDCPYEWVENTDKALAGLDGEDG